MTRYTGSSTAANSGWMHSASTSVVTGSSTTVNSGPIVCAKKNSTVSMSETAMFSRSPFLRSIRHAGARRRIDSNRWMRMEASSR